MELIAQIFIFFMSMLPSICLPHRGTLKFIDLHQPPCAKLTWVFHSIFVNYLPAIFRV